MFCIEDSFHFCFNQISLVYLWTESFCWEDFTAAFYPLHKGSRLLGGRRNGNKSSERQRGWDARALICASECPQLYLLALWPLSEIHIITLLNDFWGGILSVSLTQENGCRQTGRVGTCSSPLQANTDKLCLENPSLQFQSPRAVWLMLSESFGT